jgi:N-sulfoglucosamine sulfohydrolase
MFTWKTFCQLLTERTKSKGLIMKPNILYMHSHDTGRYIQPYGHAVPTPNLQRLAEEGVLFRQNFCVNPTCSASRASLLTGCYPHENGMTGLAHRGFALNDYGQHLLHTLRKAGYVSALAGVQHIATKTDAHQPWEVIGYDRWLGNEGRDGAIAFLENAPDEPFFLAVGFGETHRGFPALEDAPDDPRYCLPPAPLPDTPETRADMTRYKASARILDRKIGDVLDALERSGKADNTLVICTTDHGIAFPHMKCNLTDHGIGVMLLVRGPGSFDGGKVVDSMVSHLDIFPTVCELAGIETPAWLRGKSLLPLVQEGAGDLHEALFFEVNFHAAYEPLRAVRTNRWKYIRRFDGRKTGVLANCDDGESKSVWLDQGWQQQPADEEMLFDLVFDPQEACNLAAHPDYQAVLTEMRARLDRWMDETDDPLRSGPVPVPPGAKLNSPDDISPKFRKGK